MHFQLSCDTIVDKSDDTISQKTSKETVTNLEPTVLNIHHGFNFRDLGGYRGADNRVIRPHKLIRSGKLDLLSNRDVQFLDDYGMRIDVDFRSPEERATAPDRAPASASYHHLPVFPIDETGVSSRKAVEEQLFTSNPKGGYENMLLTYADMVLMPSAQTAYRRFFDLLLGNEAEGQSLLFHCSAGKDRTGMGAVYLLSALGVDDQVIRQDYIAANDYIQEPLRDQLAKVKAAGYNENYQKSIHDLWTVKEDYLNKALATIDEHFGSMRNYLREGLDLTDQQIADLQRIYLA